MDEDLQFIDDLFEKAVENHTELPTEQVWINLENTLQKKKVVSVTKEYKRWKWAAAALFIFSLATLIYCVRLTWKYKIDVKETAPNALPRNNSDRSSVNSILKGSVTSSKMDTPKIDSEDIIKEKAGPEKDYLFVNEKKIREKVNVPSKTLPESNGKIIMDPLKKRKIPAISLTARSSQRTQDIVNVKHRILKGNIQSIKEKNHGVKMKLDDESNQDRGKTINASNDAVDNSSSFIVSGHAGSTDISPSSAIPDLRYSKAVVPMTLLIKPAIVADTLKTNDAIMNMYNTFSIRLTSKRSHPGNIIAGIFYSRYGISTVLEANRPDYREDNYKQIKNHEKNRMASMFGFSLERFVWRNLTIGTGVSFSSFTTDITNKPLVARKDNNGKINYRISTSAGYAYYSITARPQPTLADSIKTLSSKITVKYVSVPLGFRYHFYTGKFGFTPALLVNANIRTMGTITTIQSLEHTYTNNITGLKSNYFDGQVGVNIGYFLNKRTEISLFPSAHLALSSMIDGNPVTARRNALGMAGALKMGF